MGVVQFAADGWPQNEFAAHVAESALLSLEKYIVRSS